MLVLRVEGGGGGGLEDIEAEAVWKSRDIANKKSIEDGGIARVKPVLVDVALMSSCSGYCQLHKYFKVCLVCNINLEPEPEQTKKGTTGTRGYIQLRSL
ncbi:hypothetical protein NEUTE1DRAFT_105219 [Neurospora tetrasperma FGSC 2508]|uniref:Uncharacterized protein n=1 Tax=Neurospora tetrasperma (strain FGSC 2508 / ATCC MYA-4615 / P0657) TaxID=510951 RepID=F8N0Y8_NEUT8|nr:uncharacterized protein NEUTE1DRAFT_105219 [Neurospora tetrasperma FGSC 2508]EGO52225.1 hypothetical protein NEUTE1DRAFT_105219 [Neurospora tetrasperma FGSC 2508]